jgi:hypothetical protein
VGELLQIETTSDPKTKSQVAQLHPNYKNTSRLASQPSPYQIFTTILLSPIVAYGQSLKEYHQKTYDLT